jgi:hypothetical protein
MKLLVDIIFKGKMPSLNLDFLKIWLDKCNYSYWTIPEDVGADSFADIVKTIQAESYVDFIISTNHLEVLEKHLKRVSINLVKDEEELEVLIFMDVADVDRAPIKENLTYINLWMLYMKDKYNFNSFRCQMDNGNSQEYFFDSTGPGPLMEQV